MGCSEYPFRGRSREPIRFPNFAVENKTNRDSFTVGLFISIKRLARLNRKRALFFALLFDGQAIEFTVSVDHHGR